MKKQLKRWIAVVTIIAMLCCVWVTATPVSAAWNEYPVGKVGVLKYNLESDGTATIVGFEAKVNRVNLVIPQTINGHTVYKISDKAFQYNYNLNRVSIPDTVKVIGQEAFLYCKNLTKVNMVNGIDNTVKQIGTSICAQCKQLTEVTLSNNINTIPTNMFQNCENLKKLTIQGDIESSGEHAFYQCKALKTITFFDGVTKIGDNTFDTCPCLAKVVVAPSVKSIASGAFVHGNAGPVIYGYKGSAAEDFALKYGNPFVDLKGESQSIDFGNGNTYSVGDVTTNKKIEADDYGFIQGELCEYISLPTLTWRYVLSDANGDGVVNVKDVTHLQRFLVNQHVTLG